MGKDSGLDVLCSLESLWVEGERFRVGGGCVQLRSPRHPSYPPKYHLTSITLKMCTLTTVLLLIFINSNCFEETIHELGCKTTRRSESTYIGRCKKEKTHKSCHISLMLSSKKLCPLCETTKSNDSMRKRLQALTVFNYTS